MSNFNYVAPVYDKLVQLVYGNNLLYAQKAFLKYVKAGSSLLIVGGGTGKVLNDILNTIPTATVFFIEPSENMLKRAKKNLDKRFVQQVHFMHGSHTHIPENLQFDVVITFFVFDVFKQNAALEFAQKIKPALKGKGLWLFADFFSTSRFFQKFLLITMYLFFKIFAGIPATRLPDFDSIFAQIELTLLNEEKFMQGFVRSRMYVKK